MYRPGSGPSKATASTLCQKCLKRDNYECKAVAQERPYVSRPSRTQQLSNPKLMPKLSAETPPELLKTKGVADDILAKREAERERSRKHDRDEESLERNADSSKRRRSLSSSVSVSTISTRSSSPRSPPRKAANDADRGRISGDQRVKRARSRSSSEYSYRSTSRTGSRSNRRRYSRDSPRPRGRGRSRSREPYRAENGRDMVTKGDGARDARDTRRNLDISSTDARRELSMARERPKERSLSPFSKRLALTRSMNN